MTTTKLIPSHLTKPHADANNYFLFNSRKKKENKMMIPMIYTPPVMSSFFIFINVLIYLFDIYILRRFAHWQIS